MLLDEGTCLFNFDPHQVSFVFSVFNERSVHHVEGVVV